MSEPHVFVIGFGTDHVDVHRPVLERRFDRRRDAHPFEHALQELRGDLGLLVEILLAEVPRGFRSRPDDHDGVLRSDPEDPGTRLLNDVDVGLLLGQAELAEGGLDGLLNAWGASSDLRHCRCLRTLTASDSTPASD